MFLQFKKKKKHNHTWNGRQWATEYSLRLTFLVVSSDVYFGVFDGMSLEAKHKRTLKWTHTWYKDETVLAQLNYPQIDPMCTHTETHTRSHTRKNGRLYIYVCRLEANKQTCMYAYTTHIIHPYMHTKHRATESIPKKQHSSLVLVCESSTQNHQ